jgi:hypothetical protein
VHRHLNPINCVVEVGWGAVDTTGWSPSAAIVYSYTYALYETADTSFVGFFPIHPDSIEIPYSAVLGPFDEAPQVEVVKPNGGEVWIGGNRQIKWHAEDDSGVDSVSIFLSFDKGYNWPDTLSTGVTSDSTWMWLVTDLDTTSTKCRVAVVAHDGDGDGGYDMSNANFQATGLGEGQAPGTLLVPQVASIDDRVEAYAHKRSLVFSVARPRNVELNLYDVRGRLVRNLWQGRVEEGLYRVEWDLRDLHGAQVANGVYFYRLVTEEYVRTGKFVLVR